MKPNQVSEKATKTIRLQFVNVSTQTDDKIHVGCHDVATLMETMCPECPERRDCDPDFLNDSFLFSETDEPLNESFKVDDLETSDNVDESQDKDSERIFIVVQVNGFLGNAFTAVLLQMQKSFLYSKDQSKGSVLEITLMCVEGHQTQWHFEIC